MHCYRCHHCDYINDNGVMGEPVVCKRCGYEGGILSERPADPNYDTHEHKEEAGVWD